MFELYAMPNLLIVNDGRLLISHFEHSQVDSCVKKNPKIDRYFFLNFDKKSVVISCIIFS